MTAGTHRQEVDRRGGAVARIAARWCRDPGFQGWIEARNGRGRTPREGETLQQAEAMARALALTACGITSRADLDHDPDALARFDELIRKPYMAFLGAQQVPEGRRMSAALAGRMDAWLAGM